MIFAALTLFTTSLLLVFSALNLSYYDWMREDTHGLVVVAAIWILSLYALAR